MGAGRKPQPRALLLLNGRSDGRDSGNRVVPQEPKFMRMAPEPPEWLSPEALAEWERVLPGLEKLELVKPEDRAALAAYCEAWSRLREATETIAREGLTSTNPDSGRVGPHPAVRIAEAASTTLRQYAEQFGLTPSAERNVSRRDDQRREDAANPFAAST